ncbi:hypothetical protein BGZ95_009522 [Linnemannia exigua]|uniref:Uncharacterized protein n=1 Tax=Linnemannia exigua TaxID=604196 RepID=A0AAD4DCR9_9FUNG|nr:hypothetical protein BGZ95_009522 [Linnemannia exigua]
MAQSVEQDPCGSGLTSQGRLASTPLQIDLNFVNGLQEPQQSPSPELPIEQGDPEPSLGQIDMEEDTPPAEFGSLTEYSLATGLVCNYIDITGPFHSGDRKGCNPLSYTVTTGLVACNRVAADIPGTWTGTRQAYSEEFPVRADLQNVRSNVNEQVVSVVMMILQLLDAFLNTSDFSLSSDRVKSLPGSLEEIQPNVDELLQSIPDSFAHIRCDLPLHSLFCHNGTSVRRIVAHLSVEYFCSPWRKTRRWNRKVQSASCVDARWFMTLQPEDETQFDDPFPDDSNSDNYNTHLPDAITLPDDVVPAPTADSTPSPVAAMGHDDQATFTLVFSNNILHDLRLESDHDFDSDTIDMTDRNASMLSDADADLLLLAPRNRSPSLKLDAAIIASMEASILRASPEPAPHRTSTSRYSLRDRAPKYEMEMRPLPKDPDKKAEGQAETGLPRNRDTTPSHMKSIGPVHVLPLFWLQEFGPGAGLTDLGLSGVSYHRIRLRQADRQAAMDSLSTSGDVAQN